MPCLRLPDSAFACLQQDLPELVSFMQHPCYGVKMSPGLVRPVFRGSDVVDWIVTKESMSRAEAGIFCSIWSLVE